MVGNSKGPREDGAGLTVLSLAVAEEQGIGGAIAMAKMAGLPHETAFQGGVIGHMGSAADYEIVGNDPVRYGNRCKLV